MKPITAKLLISLLQELNIHELFLALENKIAFFSAKQKLLLAELKIQTWFQSQHTVSHLSKEMQNRIYVKLNTLTTEIVEKIQESEQLEQKTTGRRKVKRYILIISSVITITGIVMGIIGINILGLFGKKESKPGVPQIEYKPVTIHTERENSPVVVSGQSSISTTTIQRPLFKPSSDSIKPRN